MKKILLSALLLSFTLNVSAAAYTYSEVQKLKSTSPEQVAAYLQGMAEGIFAFRVIKSGVYTFCPPKGTKIDSELIDLMATTEVRVHKASSSDYYKTLVRNGLVRTYPCK